MGLLTMFPKIYEEESKTRIEQSLRIGKSLVGTVSTWSLRGTRAPLKPPHSTTNVDTRPLSLQGPMSVRYSSWGEGCWGHYRVKEGGQAPVLGPPGATFVSFVDGSLSNTRSTIPRLLVIIIYIHLHSTIYTRPYPISLLSKGTPPIPPSSLGVFRGPLFTGSVVLVVHVSGTPPSRLPRKALGSRSFGGPTRVDPDSSPEDETRRSCGFVCAYCHTHPRQRTEGDVWSSGTSCPFSTPAPNDDLGVVYLTSRLPSFLPLSLVRPSLPFSLPPSLPTHGGQVGPVFRNRIFDSRSSSVWSEMSGSVPTTP